MAQMPQHYNLLPLILKLLTSMALMDSDQLYWAHRFQPQSLAPIPKSINEMKVN